MSIEPFALMPGVNTQLTTTANRNSYSSSDKIRWKDALWEKLGGWVRLTSELMEGVCRGLHAWADLTGNPYLIAGTNERVYVFDGGILRDVTPLRATVNQAPDFSTVINTPTVTVKDVAHGGAADDWINIPTQVAVGGLILFGYYQIATIVDVDNYTITAASNATSTVNNGGAVAVYTTLITSANVSVLLVAHGFSIGSTYAVQVATTVGGLTITGDYAVASVTDADNFVIADDTVATSSTSASQNTGLVRIEYLIPSGLASSEYTSGYGVGDYGSGEYGISSDSGAIDAARQWFWDSWGEDAIGNYSGGPFYIWIPPYSTNPRATLISQAPDENHASFVAMPQQIVVALGTEVSGTHDPSLIRWSAVADYTDWTATATNQAGSYRIPTGSGIVGGLQAPQQGLIWTDIDVWSMRYVQPPFVFGFTKLASGCGLIAARAAWVLGTDVYWMSTNGFFRLGAGGIEAVECTVWDVIFRNLDVLQMAKICAAGNADFNEIAWHFPSESGGTGENDMYVKVNTKEKDQQGRPLWDYGTMANGRTAWEDRSAVGTPIGADSTGLLQQHEVGNNADGSAMAWYIESGFLDIANGQDMMFVDQIMPDFKRDTGTMISITPKTKKTPLGDTTSYGPYVVGSTTEYIRPRVRGRLLAMRFGGEDLDSFAREGLVRFRVAPDGRGI